MQAGRLRHRIAIKRPVEARNGYGDVVSTWSLVATVWGSVEPLRGREYQQAKQSQAELLIRIRIRYRADVAPSWRLEWSGHVYDIQDVIHDNVRRELQLMCADVVEGA